MEENKLQRYRQPNKPGSIKEPLIYVNETEEELLVNYPVWKNTPKFPAFALIAFTIIWLSVVVFFMVDMIRGDEYMSQILFILAFGVVSLFLLFVVLGMIFNKTYVSVDSNRLLVFTAPFSNPFKRMKKIDRGRIDQLFIHKKELQAKDKEPKFNYELHVTMKNGEEENLLKMEDLNFLLYLEDAIEEYIGVPDKSMEGENYF